jgi:hypothetical protein
MSRQKELLREIATAINSNGAFQIAEWFTEDFRLIAPTKPNWPRGYVGAIGSDDDRFIALYRKRPPHGQTTRMILAVMSARQTLGTIVKDCRMSSSECRAVQVKLVLIGPQHGSGFAPKQQ